MAGRQRIDRVRRQYNQWVANQTLEDYALRFTAKSARRWSAARVANTALGAISFLALEAIGGTHHPQLRLHQRHGRDPGRQRHHFPLRPADRLSRRQMRHRHRPADARRRLWLYRLDHHLADLRVLHLHLLRDRSRHHGRRAGDVLRHSAADRLSHQRGRDHSAGDLRHHADQPLPIVDAAGLGRAAHPALCGDRLGQPAFVRGVDEIRRRAWRSRAAISICCCSAPPRPWCSRWWRRSASRSTSCASCRATAAPLADVLVDRAAQRRPRLDRARRAETAGRLVPRLLRAEPRRLQRTGGRARASCISKRSAMCCRSPISRWR